MADKVDPFDIDALGSAVNDSAGRVSTIWVSFLIFGLYLLTAATTVTHRQLFLAEPVKLPVLNIDLPLWGFFFLAPILYVIFHIYVLLQVLLLARTATAYNAAVDRAGFGDKENASLRQRLANTLFAQTFAGSPREREGWLGFLLKAMAWVTLLIAPVLILLVFQFAFLPYHSHIATWTHRLLILAELIIAFMLWPVVLDAQRDFDRARMWAQFKRTTALPLRLIRPKNWRRDWIWLGRQRFPLAWCVLYVVVCLTLATFPGEWHVNVFTGHWPSSVQCERWLQRKIYLVDLRFDRLDLPHVDVIDHQKLEQIEKATEKAGEKPYQGERTRVMRERDLNCSDFSDYSDLRRIDWTGAQLRGANFAHTKLQGASLANVELEGANLDVAQLQDTSLDGAGLQDASLDGANLQGAYLLKAQLQGAKLNYAQLQGANLDRAQLQGASLLGATLQGASLFNAELQGAFFPSAKLQGAELNYAQLQGANLDRAQLQGANLNFAQLQGALLGGTELQGASLNDAKLQGVSLDGTQLQGASLNDADLQGADFSKAVLDHSVLSRVWTWRARACASARVIDHKPDNVIDAIRVAVMPGLWKTLMLQATPGEVAKFIERSVAKIPGAKTREFIVARLRERLLIDTARDDTAALAELWSNCEAEARKTPQEKFDEQHAAFLRNLVCDATEDRAAIAQGIVRIWIVDSDLRRAFSAQLARGLLGQDGKECLATTDFDTATRNKLRAAAAKTVPVAAPAK
jgi:uncharacterized protein YjbI with pentapeptide repeats